MPTTTTTHSIAISEHGMLLACQPDSDDDALVTAEVERLYADDSIEPDTEYEIERGLTLLTDDDVTEHETAERADDLGEVRWRGGAEMQLGYLTDAAGTIYDYAVRLTEHTA